MCGIVGFFGDFSPEMIDSMSNVIAHRGPDDHGSMVIERPGARIALAQRRLSILDLSASGHQPMTLDCSYCGCNGSDAPSGKMWLVFNGEIYNYRELRARLETEGHRFHSRTDSEVLLHLYAEYGTDMLQYLNGIFAFAIYDGRPNGNRSGVQRGDLFLARDGLGVKPLYYAETGNGVLFASELKAILASRAVPRTLQPEAIHYYLTYLWAPAPFTPLAGVKKMRPGEALIIRDGHVVRNWMFYDLPYGQELLSASEADVAAELRDRVRAAVERQLVADVPVGAFLSGGLDSSAVVAMMRQALPNERIQCYTIGFPGADTVEGNPNDLPYAQRVAAHLGVDLKVLEVQPDIIRLLPQMIYHLDEPQADPAPINAMLIAEQARRDGIKVLMSGAGGDDIFSGYRRHLALSMERYWAWAPQLVRSQVSRYARAALAGSAPVAMMRSTNGRRLAKMLANADLPADERLVSYFYWGDEGLRRSLYSPQMAEAIRGVTTAEPLLESLNRIPAGVSPLDRMLYLEGKHFLADHNLSYTDKTSMAFGVEVRVPLLDMELVDFATRIPAAMKQKGSMGKAIFKKAMEPYLPREVIYRAKSGFGAPLRRWIQHELRDVVGDILSPAAIRRRGLFDPDAVQRLISLNASGRIDGAYTIFSLLCLELWCRMFLDGEIAPPGAMLQF